MKIEPIGLRLIVEPVTLEETSAGLEVASSGNSIPVKGKIIAVSPNSSFAIGQVIFFRRYAVDELKTYQPDGSEQTLSMVDEEDVLARVVEN